MILPTYLQTLLLKKGIAPGMRCLSALIIIGVVVGIIVLVVILQGGERKIAVQMSQKVQGRRQVGGQQSNIPLKVNTAGVIPIIFSSSLLQFPVVIASFLGKDNGSGIGSEILRGSIRVTGAIRRILNILGDWYYILSLLYSSHILHFNYI